MTGKCKRLSKNIIIAVLLCSTLALTYYTWFSGLSAQDASKIPVVGALIGLFTTEDQTSEAYAEHEEYASSANMISPVRAALRSDNGLCSLPSRDGARALYERMSSVLAEAMDTAETPEPVEREEWIGYLSGNMVFFDFEGNMPLGSVASVIGADERDDMDYSVRYVILAVGDDGVTFCFMTGDGDAYACATTAKAMYFKAYSTEYTPDGAYFAYENEDTEGLISDECMFGTAYSSMPDLVDNAVLDDSTSVESEHIKNQLLDSFGYNIYTTGSYVESDGARVYVEDFSSTLRVYPDGDVTFYSADLADADQDSAPGQEERTELIQYSVSIMEKTVSPYMGDAYAYVTEEYYDARSGRYIVMFGYEYKGITIDSDDGYFARFEFRDGKLCVAYLTLASFTATGELTDILPAYLAAAAAENGEAGELAVKYKRSKDGTYTTGWYFKSLVRS